MKFLNEFLLVNTNNFLIKKIQKKISKLLKIYFVPTSLNSLPQNNYEMKWDINYQENLLQQYKKKNHLISFNTFPEISNTLNKYFPDKDYNFKFLDFGGENIDFYLEIRNNFKNVNYFVYNKKEVNNNFEILKKRYNLNNLTILKDFNEIKKYKYDFVNFGSVIQYVNNYKDVLKEIIGVSKKFILFSGTHFYDLAQNEIMVVKQVNLLPNKFYCYFFHFENFFSIFESRQFSIIFKNENKTDKLSYKNFKNLNRIQYTDLLLSK